MKLRIALVVGFLLTCLALFFTSVFFDLMNEKSTVDFATGVVLFLVTWVFIIPFIYQRLYRWVKPKTAVHEQDAEEVS